MAIEPRRREHMDAVDGYPLRLVDRGGVAVIDLVIVLDVERDRAPIVEHHRHACLREGLDGAERSILHAHAALVFQEHDPVAGRECTATAFCCNRDGLAQLARRAQPVARCKVKVMHGVIGVGEDDPAGVGMRLTITVPAVDQIGAGPLSRLGRVHMPSVVIGANGFSGPAGGKLARRITLPVFALAADLGDLDTSVSLGNRPERRASFDRLKLFWVTDQHDLRAALFGLGYDSFHLARTDHPGLVDHQHIAVGEELPPLFPLMFEAGDRARRDA
ncbi:hypothetical protein D9M73_104230 [compost metagenome]